MTKPRPLHSEKPRNARNAQATAIVLPCRVVVAAALAGRTADDKAAGCQGLEAEEQQERCRREML